MLFNIFSVLEKIGLNAQKRAIHVQFSNELLNHQVFLQRIEGQHQLNGGLMAELICLSTNAQIALKQFIGVQVAVDQVTDSGQLFRTTGIVTEASYEQYRKNNIIDLGTNSNGFGTGNTLNSVGKRFKAVCEKALKDGIISGFISADVAGEGAMHIEIIQ